MHFAPPENTILAHNFRNRKDNSILMTYLNSSGRKQLEQPQKSTFNHIPISFHAYLSEKHTVLGIEDLEKFTFAKQKEDKQT